MERMAFGLGQVKLAGDASAMEFSGYGAVFGNVDAYGDVIQPGAFAETLAEAQKTGQWPAMLLQHGGAGFNAEDETPIGIWTKMAEDGIGLQITGKLADTTRGREAYALLKMEPRPALNGLSIGYIAKAYEPRSKPEDPRRKLTKIDLFEVSLVTFPANGKARVSQVKAGDMTEREIERLLTRDAGMSRSDARALMRGGLSALKALRDAGEEGFGEIAEALRRRNAAFL